MTTRCLAIALVLGATLLRPIPTRAQSCSNQFYKQYRHIYKPNHLGHTQGLRCGAQGWCNGAFPTPGCETPYSPCHALVDLVFDQFRCESDAYFSQGFERTNICPCDGDPTLGAGALVAKPDGSIASTDYQCNQSCTCSQQDNDPQYCDGRECTVIGAVDEACGNDEHQCTSAHGTDPFPVNLSSGRVESQPITLFSLPAPAGIHFGYTVKYDSHARFAVAVRRTIGGVPDAEPTIHHADEATHIAGRNWIDSFSDRLMISVHGLDPLAITWSSIRGIVTFKNTAGTWKSTSGKFVLIDRGSVQ